MAGIPSWILLEADVCLMNVSGEKFNSEVFLLLHVNPQWLLMQSSQ
jgi:hypothetical protein